MHLGYSAVLLLGAVAYLFASAVVPPPGEAPEGAEGAAGAEA